MTFKSQDFNPWSFTVKLRSDNPNFQLEQDVEHYRKYAEESRKMDELAPSKRQYRSFCIIPDIVAVDIMVKYGIDIHAPEFMSDTAQVQRVKKIVMSEYPHLLTSNITKV